MSDPGPVEGRAARGGQEARVTPYELAFGEAGYELKTFPSIQAEAEEQGVDPSDPDRFSFLTVGAEAIREVVPPDASPEALEHYRTLLYHAFNFWRFGRRYYVLEAPVVRYLVEAAPDLSGWELTLPQPSVYVQLPPNLFWASVDPDVPPEPVDGFFVSCARHQDPFGKPYDVLEVLMVLGIRSDRAGFSTASFSSQVGQGIAAVWAETPGRDVGRDFENVLPGGEISGLYSILTVSEALKLIARALWYVDRHPGQVTAHAAPERRAHDRPGALPLSRLPYHRVVLDGGDGEAAPRA